MTITEIRQLLESPYNQKEWKVFLQSHFTNGKLFGDAHSIELMDKTISKKCYSLGNYEVNEYTKIGIFEVQLNDTVKLTRNRVGLRNLIKSITQQVAGAMVVFVQGEKWRFSYISKRKVKNKETNTIEDKETAPKRYTYLFGKGEKALTAAQRFDKLIQKQQGNIFQFLTLNDFEEAFSVEKLSKDFFNEYKKSYEDFVEFITGKRYLKKGNKFVETIIHPANFQLRNLFGNDEKQARDFCKRMMGRIVFLYFIQKKGWLACPSIVNDKSSMINWGQGDQDYLYNLFKNSKHKDDFYSQELVPLFFKTLNNPQSQTITPPANNSKSNQSFNQKNHSSDNVFFPYLNGGLFDDSHDRKFNKLAMPTEIFENLFNTFNNFNFTIYEDAPDEHTVAVDPEMLGHIFENLLEDNKDKGAFYTPKEIVHYMCRESLAAYLTASDELNIADNQTGKETINKIIQQQELSKEEIVYAEKNAFKIIDALEQVKICDPAIGSGAFPMGILQEIFNAQIYLQELKGFTRKQTEAEIKKHIIEESIYGVDIDAGAVDIARLRFWLSLVVDETEPQPLPNLSFKIVCANTLIPLGKIKNLDIGGTKEIADDLAQVRHDYFNASMEEKTALETKFTSLQKKLLTTAKHWVTKEDAAVYQRLLEFSPFEESSCTWFDPWWMFGVNDGFDIVIGNPPYRVVKSSEQSIYPRYKVLSTGELYAYFFENCISNLTKNNGSISFITASLFIKGLKFKALRNFLEENTKLISLEVKGDNVFENVQMPTAIFIGKKNADKTSRWSFSDFEENSSILKNIETNSTLLSDISEIMRGFEIGRDKVSSIGDIEFITGSDIEKWAIKEKKYISKEVAKEFEKDISFFENERILIRETGRHLTSIYLKEKLLCNRSLYSIKIINSNINTKYVTGLLNSSLLQFYYISKFKSETDLFPKIRISQAKLLPVKLVVGLKQTPFVNIVDYLLYLNDKSSEHLFPQTNERIAAHLEDVLNMMVYELYFEEHMKEVDLIVCDKLLMVHSGTIQEQIIQFYEWYMQPNNEVRKRIGLIAERSPNILHKIQTATN